MSTGDVYSIKICGSCLWRHDIPKVARIREVSESLTGNYPGQSFQVSKNSCMRFCPNERIALTVNGKMTMSHGTSTDSIVHEIETLVSEIEGESKPKS